MQRLDAFADAADPRRTTGKAHRHVGAERERGLGERGREPRTGLADEAEEGGGIGRAAADAGGDRQTLVENEMKGRKLGVLTGRDAAGERQGFRQDVRAAIRQARRQRGGKGAGQVESVLCG
ncbi:hypothetical protein GCM10011390_37300 [Aureimonas endophytica]|uniref:Uncharacterized protein n=1 Tax=Aureimonas endophytica TaxID=2027858 RepID=A0A916ZUG4_9HYPH|nr:hypothetical protein GCM10011390_37300 [Aureimonas endophytica]